MRIRKNAKLSPLLFSSSCLQGGSVPVETHVCQLNQSPWDVIPFDSHSIQFQPDDSFTAGNNNGGSAGDSFGAVESVASMDKMEHAMTIVAEDNSKAMNIDATRLAKANPCQTLDDNGWPCKNEAKQGQSFCDQHLSLSVLTSYNNKKAQAQARRAKTRGAGKKATAAASSNPYEFYYYSGFGPLWGKRRGDRNGEGSRSGVNSTMVESDNVVGGAGDVVVDDINDNVGKTVAVGPSVLDSGGIIDYVDVDVDDDEDEDDSGKKRMRKPVKARSLKSLM